MDLVLPFVGTLTLPEPPTLGYQERIAWNGFPRSQVARREPQSGMDMPLQPMALGPGQAIPFILGQTQAIPSVLGTPWARSLKELQPYDQPW